MASQQGSIRKRKDASVVGKSGNGSPTAITTPYAKDTTDIDVLVKNTLKQKAGPEWDYRIAITLITILGFVTRFWGISHPNEVVFDEVHFGKVYEVLFHMGSLLTSKYSSLPTIFNAHISSMYIHHSESCCLH